MSGPRSDIELLALHAVRLEGMAAPATAAARFSLGRDVVGEPLAAAAAAAVQAVHSAFVPLNARF